MELSAKSWICAADLMEDAPGMPTAQKSQQEREPAPVTRTTPGMESSA